MVSVVYDVCFVPGMVLYHNGCFHSNVGSSYAGGQWAAGDEPLYYIVSPKDVVIAKPRLISISLSYCTVINF